MDSRLRHSFQTFTALFSSSSVPAESQTHSHRPIKQNSANKVVHSNSSRSTQCDVTVSSSLTLSTQKSASSSKTDKSLVPIEEIRISCQWIHFFCGLSGNRLCIPEVEELILFPPIIDENQRNVISGPMATFQELIQNCGMKPQEWFDFVMCHDSSLAPTPAMLLPTFTKAIVKMCLEINAELISDESIRNLYLFMIGSRNSPIAKAQFVDEGFTAFDFALAFAKFRLPARQIDSFNNIARTVQNWGSYLRDLHLSLTVLGGMSLHSVRTGIMTAQELEKVLCNLYIKHQQYLRYIESKGFCLLSSNLVVISSTGHVTAENSKESAILCSNKSNSVSSTLGAAEAVDDSSVGIPFLAPELDQVLNIEPTKKKDRQRSLFNTLSDLIQSVRASFVHMESFQVSSAPSCTLPLGSTTIERKSHSKACKASSAVHPIQKNSVENLGNSTSYALSNQEECVMTSQYYHNMENLASTCSHLFGNAESHDDNEEMQERRRRRSIQHKLPYSALFAMDSTTSQIAHVMPMKLSLLQSQ